MFKLKDWIFLFAFLLASLFVSQSLYALTILQVTKSTDEDPGGSGEAGDLRFAINTMNNELNTGSDEYAIIFETPMTIYLNGILPIINNSSHPVNITIGNPGSIPTVTIDGGGKYSGFFIPTGNVTIQNMIFQNLIAKGGDGGSGNAAGGGGMGAGGAIYAPTTFLNGSTPSITLMNVLINNCSAVGGTGGSYFTLAATGEEGGGGGGGFSGNGGSVTAVGDTGGAGGGGFGGNGGDVVSTSGGGGGGGGFGSRTDAGGATNLGDGGTDQDIGLGGNGYGLTFAGGSGAGGNQGGSNAGGGGGGTGTDSGGGGGGSSGSSGLVPGGGVPPLHSQGTAHTTYCKIKSKKVTPCVATIPSKGKPNNKNRQFEDPIVPSGGGNSDGGTEGDGGGAGGGGVVIYDHVTPGKQVDGAGGIGGYGGGGGGGAGTGSRDINYTVQGGAGGVGGGGGGGGVNDSGTTSANGGDSSGGGGGGGGGPSSGKNAAGGSDIGNLGGGRGGDGADTNAGGSGGGGGGGGSGLGGAIFVDKSLNFTIQAITGVPTTFNTSNNTVEAGVHGTGSAAGATDGQDGSALGNSIFLCSQSSLTLMANDTTDLLTLGDGVSFVDDTSFGAGDTAVFVKGNGTVIYNGNSDYQGRITVNNANFKVNGEIDEAHLSVCRDVTFSSQRGTLSGTGNVTGDVFVNSGTISPDAGGTIRLGSLILSPADSTSGSLGSLVHIDIGSGGSSLIDVAGSSSLAGTLEINLDSDAEAGTYTLLTSAGGITGTFDSVTFTGKTPKYSLSYLPAGAPTHVELNFLGYTSVDIPATVNGSAIINPAVVCCGRPIILGPLPVPGSGPTVYTVIHQTGNVTCQIGQTGSQTYLRVLGPSGSCTISGTKDGVTSNPLTVSVP